MEKNLRTQIEKQGLVLPEWLIGKSRDVLAPGNTLFSKHIFNRSGVLLRAEKDQRFNQDFGPIALVPVIGENYRSHLLIRRGESILKQCVAEKSHLCKIGDEVLKWHNPLSHAEFLESPRENLPDVGYKT